MPVTLVRGSIVEERADAVVTAANAQLAGGGGVDGVVHRAAGPRLLAYIRTLGGCPTGSAVISPAFDLEARGVRHVIHAVGPIWRGGNSGEADLLASAYRRSVELAVEAGCASVAFPAISTGVYGYPVERAAPVALRTVREALDAAGSTLEARFVLIDSGTFRVFANALDDLDGERKPPA
ncbi:macro domain-containing protein [Deinococcus pimensis]|uniref:macro domain-containing protein n=1 Tax=Deinococcus pimensis TaxID=309888 RepID=UPI0004866046|nr:macro domain-containing protein [Deinococcus pimensis]